LTTHHMAWAEKLRKVVGLFASSHHGERAAAVSAANRILAELDLTWAEVISLPEKQAAAPETLSELCGWALACAEILTPWQLNFLRTVSALKSVSPRQRDVLDDITTKVRAYRAAGGAA